jgi:hypothetical protein
MGHLKQSIQTLEVGGGKSDEARLPDAELSSFGSCVVFNQEARVSPISKRIYERPMWLANVTPGHRLSLHAERSPLELQVGIAGFVSERRDETAMPELKQHLSQLGYARCRLEMPDTVFYRPHRNRPVSALVSKSFQQSSHLTLVHRQIAGGSKLDVVHVFAFHSGALKGLRDNSASICRTGKVRAPTVVVERATADHRVDPVTVTDSGGHRLE